MVMAAEKLSVTENDFGGAMHSTDVVQLLTDVIGNYPPIELVVERAWPGFSSKACAEISQAQQSFFQVSLH